MNSNKVGRFFRHSVYAWRVVSWQFASVDSIRKDLCTSYWAHVNEAITGRILDSGHEVILLSARCRWCTSIMGPIDFPLRDTLLW